MGFAKYHEDDVLIIDDRNRFRDPFISKEPDTQIESSYSGESKPINHTKERKISINRITISNTYECQICGTKYVSEDALKMHMKKHSGEQLHKRFIGYIWKSKGHAKYENEYMMVDKGMLASLSDEQLLTEITAHFNGATINEISEEYLYIKGIKKSRGDQTIWSYEEKYLYDKGVKTNPFVYSL